MRRRLSENSLRGNQSGVTLIELVAVIVLMGIVGIGLINVIRSSVEAYREVTRRDEISQIGRFAIERVSRELRAALPGSIRENDDCIEFVPILAASFYKENTLPVASDSADEFVVVEFELPDRTPSRASIYALAADDVYSESHFETVNWPPTFASGQATVEFSSSAQSFPEHSPGRRVYFVDTPVSFCVVGTELLRYAEYGYSSTAIFPPSANGVLLAEFIRTNDNGISVAPFDFEAAGLQRNGIVHLDFRFQDRNDSDEWVRFNHDVALRGLP